jgi:S1-C subfamily serine protease
MVVIKIERKGGNYYYYGNKESEKKKREELADKKKKEEEKKIVEIEKKKPEVSPDDNKVVFAGSGSGLLVSSEGHIITNHHVIDGCNTTKVNFKGNQIDTQILAVDKANDIAILITNIKPERIFSVSNNDVSLLDDIIVAGFPLTKISSAIKTSKGVVTALAGSGDNYSEFQTDTVINAGNSGGPIINQKGNVVGIAVSSWIEEGVEGFHFGIKSSTLRTFANSNSLKLTQANNIELSNKDLGKLIIEATVYLECHMTVADIKKMMAAENNQKAFFSEFK